MAGQAGAKPQTNGSGRESLLRARLQFHISPRPVHRPKDLNPSGCTYHHLAWFSSDTTELYLDKGMRGSLKDHGSGDLFFFAGMEVPESRV